MARTLVVAGLALIACDAPPAGTRPGDAPCVGVACSCEDDAPGEWRADLRALDGSDATGSVRIRTGEYGATLWLEADGLEPDREHPQQLRGHADGSPAACPDPDRADPIDLADASGPWGDVLEHLGPFPMADADGTVRYEAHWDGGGACPVDARVVVMTGAWLDDAWDPRAPVLCGDLARTDTLH